MRTEVLSTDEDLEDKNNLRPNCLEKFIGQKHIINNLQIFIKSAVKREASLDHVLLSGPPGTGKTTLAMIIAKEMQVNIKVLAGPSLSKSADLAAILTNLQKGDVLFLDEIHRLPIAVEEVLYSAMEDYRIDIIIGEGPAARTVKINVNSFTLIGATTRLGLLSNPLRDRFGIPLKLSFYTVEELRIILRNANNKLNMNISDEGIKEIAGRSRGTPRIALRLLNRIRDFYYVKNIKEANKNFIAEVLLALEVDSKGLDKLDHGYLHFISYHCKGGPVGIDTISAYLCEQKDTIEDMIEPYLLQIGFIERTSRGRMLTATAIEYYKKYMLDKSK